MLQLPAAESLSFLIAGLLIGLALQAPAVAQPVKVSPAACVPRTEDHTFLWWADGFRGRSPDGRWLRCIQTGHYALAMDVERMKITNLGPVARPLPYGEAVAQDNGVVLALPPADLGLAITVDGAEYRCVRGGAPTAHAGPRLVEGGRFLQRADITDLVFENGEGKSLDADARFEMVAWPDRLTLLLEATPARLEPAPGPSFGRVGGGYYFDGTNHIEVPPAPELAPEQLTLALWVYVPEGPPATRHYPWLVCANGHEWADGHYGLALINNVPAAFLNIGGGRENVHTVSAKDPRHARPLGDEALKREQWHHLALTYDGADLRLYVDGEERASAHVATPRNSVPGPIALGRRQDNSGDGYHFRGAMDEVRLYSRALTVKALAGAPEAVKPDPALVREWCFDPGGLAATERPSGEWRNASMTLSLRVGDETLADQMTLQPDEAWTRGDVRQVALSLRPGSRQVRIADEPSPVKVAASAFRDRSPRPVEYDALRDWYRLDLDGLEPDGQGNDSLERVRVTLTNPDSRERTVHLLFDKNGSGIRVRGVQALTGMSPLLRDLHGDPAGIPVQISKNWHRQPDRDLLYQGPWLHGFTLLHLPPRSEVDLEFDLAYAHWGGVAAASHAQLCLIGWGSNQLWDQSAIGAWGESICYEPDQAQAECAVLDVRPLLVHQMGRDEPVKWCWTNNVGGGDFFRYFDAEGRRQYPARMKTAYLRQGPNLTEVTYAGRSADGKLEHRATVSIYRTDDLTRGIYRLRLDVRQPTDFKRLVFFQIGADTYSYTGERKMALGNEDGLAREWDTQWGGDAYKTPRMELVGRVPWVSLHDAVSRDKSRAGAWANRGAVLRHWDARLGGRPAAPWVAEHGVKARGEDTSLVDFLPPPGLERLVPGDYVEATFEHVIMPQYARDYYGPNENLRAALTRDENTWRLIHREAVGNDVAVQVSEGVLERDLPIRVRAAEGRRARFTVAGGLGYVPITLSGLSGYTDPVLEMREGEGPWRRVDQAVHGGDFWQADYDPADRSWELTYTVPLDTPGEARQTREFRFRLGAR